MRYLRLWGWRDIQIGRWLVLASIVLCMGSFVSFCNLAVTHAEEKSQDWGTQRALILRHLEQDGERHLVIVRYGPDHSVHNEWVYNEADIDSSRVVWARDMAFPENQDLINYFNDRRLWLLEADERIPELKEYPAHRQQ